MGDRYKVLRDFLRAQALDAMRRQFNLGPSSTLRRTPAVRPPRRPTRLWGTIAR